MKLRVAVELVKYQVFNMYNADKYKESVTTGKKAEALFKRVAEERNFSVTKSTLQQDRMEHWDFEIIKILNSGFYKRKIDVKGIKKINGEFTDEFIFLEIQNVGGGKGWLYGQADGIAFQMKNEFIINFKGA